MIYPEEFGGQSVSGSLNPLTGLECRVPYELGLILLGDLRPGSYRAEWSGAWYKPKQTKVAMTAGQGLHLGTTGPVFWREVKDHDTRVQLWNPCWNIVLGVPAVEGPSGN